MKAMMISDLISVKKYLAMQSALSVVVSLFIVFSTQSLYAIPPCMGFMVAFTLIMYLFAFDERNDWEGFRLTMPLSRKQVISGRYAFCLLATLAGTVSGLAVLALVAAFLALTESAAPGAIPGAATMLVDFGWQPILLVCTISICLMLLVMTICIPLVSRFGMTQAVRFIPLAPVLAIPLIALLVEQMGLAAPQAIIDFIAWVFTSTGTISVCAAAAAFFLIAYAISYVLSLRFYQKREF